MKQTRWKYILVVIFFLFFYTQVFAKTKQPKPVSPLLVVTADFPPFSFTNENKEHQGLAYDIVKAVLEQSGQPYSIKRLPWKRALETAKKRPHTLLFPCARSETREPYFFWIGEISKRSISFFKLKKRTGITINTIDDVFNYSVTAVRGYKATDRYLKNGDGQVIQAATDQQVLKILQSGRADLILNEDLVVAWSLKQFTPMKGSPPLTFSDLEKVLQYEEGSSRYFVLNINTPKVIADRLQEAYRDLAASGEIEHIFSHYR